MAKSEGTTGTVDVENLTDHDRDFVSRALEERAERIDKIGDAAQKAGYAKESTVFRGDAAYAREQLVPAFRPQLEAFAKTEAEAKAGIANILFELIKDDIERKSKPAETCNKIADRVLAYGKEIYDRAFAAGVANRQESGQPAVLIASLKGLRLGSKNEDEE